MNHEDGKIYGTTILSVRNKHGVVVGGDGQVSFGNSVMKSTARKVRRLYQDQIITGFAGATADAFTLFSRLEAKLEQYNGQLMRSCIELAKDWRMDKYLRRLEAMMIVADKDITLTLTGSGDVFEPENNIAAIGSGSNFALSAARAFVDSGVDMPAKDIVTKSLNIAADICIYTNNNITLEEIKS